MIKRALLALFLLAACRPEDEPDEPELDVITQAATDPCPVYIGAYSTALAGWDNGSSMQWHYVPGSQTVNWCAYNRPSGWQHLWWSIPAGGDCARINATAWQCWHAGGVGGTFNVWCPTDVRVMKPSMYSWTTASGWKPWRADWVTYETNLSVRNASNSQKEGSSRLRCDYAQTSLLFVWRP